MENTKIVACIDQSTYSAYVTDYAAWFASILNKPLELLHIGDCPSPNMKNDVTQKTPRRQLLNMYYNRALEKGVEPSLLGIHEEYGYFIEKIIQYESKIDLLVMGRRGEQTEKHQEVIGKSIQQIMRTLHTPILTIAEEFKTPKNSMLAFSGSEISKRLVKHLAQEKYCLSIPLYLIMSGDRTAERQEELDWAHKTLEHAGYKVISSFILGGGNIEDTVIRTVQEQCIDILFMGAFENNSLYNMIFGSKTVDLLRYLNIPILHLH
ncbi:Nucleotide-binding universal stress protein [Commensalibacter communis]|uniref:universal stress protein n=1 Tax=Commensalibacter communis TaxID=2972786 RepID=UPI0022FF91A9|nr:universal stress protein [Commensalibacter communis]CAI3938136.1 Nucleotide-binding universal stress protein [Commensalibacter communis]CAI3939373.1 Nucleotide-binding universal stress protein [Commensalibacter communis]